MKLGRITMALRTSAPVAVADTLMAWRLWGDSTVPRKVKVNYREVSPTAEWHKQHANARGVRATFGDVSGGYLSIQAGGPAGPLVAASFDFPEGRERLVELLSQLPFSVASFRTLHPEWYTRDSPYRDVDVPTFGQNHFPHGWACAFRGDGHRSLVSRRWLDHGPWQVVHGANDTTLVQFHDLGVDAETALSQAKPAHRRMGITDEGGFLQTPYFYEHDISGLYGDDEHDLRIVVIGRTVSALEMRDACAARRNDALGPERPIETIAYVFPEPAEAHAHLPRLWPYELECWTIVDGREVRLDTEEPPEGMGA
ncbi:hypothetical protein ABT115_04585 [Streptomyces sp. NPDC001832]|uniref:hypothetical protein n=1 Tax=Streptomyces sp. NPDC001832 TaxID=3154527 RepID=UPI0033322982